MSTMVMAGQSGAIGVEQFSQELAGHLGRLRGALRRMLVELGSPRTPTVMQRQLRAGYTICWQIFQVVRQDDGSSGTQHAPSLGALKRLIVPARASGVTPETADDVEAAADAFHRFIRQHAEDRDYFDAMVAGTSGAGNARNVLVQRRRAAYRANSHVWGAQNDLWLVSGLLRRTPGDPARVDLISLSRQQGLRRLRADATVSLLGMKIDAAASDADAQDPAVKDAVDPAAAAATGMPLLPEFSTVPLPRVVCTTTRTGRRVFNWIDDRVGLKSSCDISTGTVTHGIPLVVGYDGRPQATLTSTVRSKASALLVLDLLVHRASFPGVSVQAMVHEAIDGAATLDDLNTVHHFAIEEGVARLGKASSANLAEFPQYRAMLEHAAGRVGWDLGEFDVYRLRVPFPVMGVVHRLFFYDSKPAAVSDQLP